MPKLRFPAEWECRDSVIMLSLPHPLSDWNTFLPDALDEYAMMLQAFRNTGQRVLLLTDSACRPEEYATPQLLPCLNPDELLTIVSLPINDTWTRDYGPLWVETPEGDRLLDFGFNGWGLKFPANHDNLVNMHLEGCLYHEGNLVNHRDYVLEGGSLESDGKGTVLTTTRCLCSPNRNGGLSKSEVEKELRERLGIDRVLWLDFGALPGDDTDSHIDTLARMAPGDTILYVEAGDPSDPRHDQLAAMHDQLAAMRTREDRPYRLIPLPLPPRIFDPADGHELPATYANYLVTPTHVYIPAYGCEKEDRRAMTVLAEAFPNHVSVSIPCKTLLRQHGSLHCSTMQIPARLLNLQDKTLNSPGNKHICL